MKQVTLCGGCGKVIRVAGSFTAELTRNKKVGDIELPETEKRVIKLCRKCAEEAGYKVK
jgi:hypothetical protein